MKKPEKKVREEKDPTFWTILEYLKEYNPGALQKMLRIKETEQTIDGMVQQVLMEEMELQKTGMESQDSLAEILPGIVESIPMIPGTLDRALLKAFVASVSTGAAIE